MGIIYWIIFGFIVGALAKLIMPGRDPGGFVITTALGVAGAVVGGFIGTQLGLGSVSGFNIGSFVIAILGAIVLLSVYRFVKKR